MARTTGEGLAPRIAVVTRSLAIQKSLEALLESADLPVKCYHSGQSLLDDNAPAHPACVVLHCETTGSGAHLEDILLRLSGARRVILLADAPDLTRGIRHMPPEVFDYFELPFSPLALLDSVRAAIANGAGPPPPRAVAEGLTERERQVLQHLVWGDSAKRIGKALGISPRTVETHRAHIMDKVSARNLADLVRIAVQSSQTSSRSDPY